MGTLGLLVDSGCNGFMLKDKTLLKEKIWTRLSVMKWAMKGCSHKDV